MTSHRSSFFSTYGVVIAAALWLCGTVFWCGGIAYGETSFDELRYDDFPLLNISGFSWAENLIFDGVGNLFVSDFTTGVLHKISFNDSSDSYEMIDFAQVSGHAAGLSSWSPPSVSGDVAALPSGPSPFIVLTGTNDGENVVIIYAQDGTSQIVGELSTIGNGLALWTPSDQPSLITAFVTAEADFVPFLGEVFRVNVNISDESGSPSNGDVIMNKLTSPDGLRLWCPTVNQTSGCLLYISQALTKVFLVYDVDSNSVVNKFNVPSPAKLVDDFCISPDGSTIYAADFIGGAVISFASDGSSPESTVIATGFTSPTSVRIGSGYGFRNTSLYVTEGGGLSTSDTNRRVIEIPGVL
eukprot:TRINITY_DN14653_c0_g1_i1.p1 TRINITY_DN14653_c0_g1~~TRINITY_DN14653_c0_g1_i1.p1  ORF type:complete len:355 (-),score=60.57 TRINITY_DN14653_c0_g1_i1:94-1158(-)